MSPTGDHMLMRYQPSRVLRTAKWNHLQPLVDVRRQQAFRQTLRGALGHTHVGFVAIWEVSTAWATNCFGGELWSAGPPSL